MCLFCGIHKNNFLLHSRNSFKVKNISKSQSAIFLNLAFESHEKAIAEEQLLREKQLLRELRNINQNNLKCAGRLTNRLVNEAYSEPCQISKIELFWKAVIGFHPLNIFENVSCQITERFLNTPLCVCCKQVFTETTNFDKTL